MMRFSAGRMILMLALLTAAFVTCAGAQTSSVTFTVNPTIFPVNQASSAFLCVSAIGVSPLTLSTGDRFTFTLGSSIGSVTSVTTPISVNSATLVATDFSASAVGNTITVIYNGVAKSFSFGNSVCVKVNFTSSAQVGSGDVSISSRFTPTINGNSPFVPVSIVNFSTGPSGTPGPPGPPGPPGAPGPVAFLTNHSLSSGGFQSNDSILSISSSSNQTPPGFPEPVMDLSSETVMPSPCTISQFKVLIDTDQSVSTTTMTFTLRRGTFVTLDPTNVGIVTSDIANTNMTCTITGTSHSCTSVGGPVTISAGDLVDIRLSVTPINTLLPGTENAHITVICK
jgi:hypothetical protein